MTIATTALERSNAQLAERARQYVAEEREEQEQNEYLKEFDLAIDYLCTRGATACLLTDCDCLRTSA